MKNFTRTTLAAVALGIAALFATGAQAQTVVFSDNFDSVVNGLNLVPSGWTVTDGTVDTIISGNFGLTCAGGSGGCIDLDGSSGDAGVLSKTFALAAGTYTFSWDLSGNQRGGQDSAQATIAATAPGFASTVALATSLPSSAGFSTYSKVITFAKASSVTLSFANTGGDNVGLILDNVNIVSSVPEPESFAMLLAGLGLMGFVAKRKSLRV